MKLTNLNAVIYKLEQILIDPAPIADCYEWISVAMHHIGVMLPNKLKVKTLTIEDYRASIPCDFQEFDRFLQVDDNKEITDLTDNSQPAYMQTILAYANPRFPLHDFSLNSSYNDIRHSFNSNLIPEERSTWNTYLDYRFENTKILFSNVKDGSIKLQYWGVWTDENDLPLVLEDETYLEACMWYCAKQLCYQAYKFKNKDFTLDFLESKWKRYCIQARAEINMPDLHTMQRMYNESLRLLPITDHYYTSFRYLGSQQDINRHGRYK